MTHNPEPPHALHRQKLFSLFDEYQTGVVYLRGGELKFRYDSHYEYPFRQESSFWYLTGVNEPDYHLLLDLKKRAYHLFAPKRDTQFAVWHGRIRPTDEILELYRPDHLHFDTELLTVLRELSPDVVYCRNEEQAEYIEDLDRSLEVDTESFSDAITYCRSLKTDWELEQMRGAARVNNIAHREVLKRVRPGLFEYEMKAVFEYHQVRYGLTQDAYNGIHASGPNSAILHYTACDRQLKEGDLYLVDAGYEYNGYASDVTRTYPVNGTFSGDQAAVYQVVRNAHKAAVEKARPGIKMEDLHILAARIILEGLGDIGFVKGSVDDLMENDIFALFFPHGLGHFLGLDTHDVGGYPKGVERIERPGIRFLRARRLLHPGMVITIEPGVYFIPTLLKPALEESSKAAFLNSEKLERFFGFGGVRIENNLIITEEGNEDLTDVPVEIKDIEEAMKEGSDQ